MQHFAVSEELFMVGVESSVQCVFRFGRLSPSLLWKNNFKRVPGLRSSSSRDYQDFINIIL